MSLDISINVPTVSFPDAVEFVKKAYGVDVTLCSLKSLPSYDDQNIYMKDASTEHSYVLKLHNILLNDQNVFRLEAQNFVTDVLRQHNIVCSSPLRKTADWIEYEKEQNVASSLNRDGQEIALETHLSLFTAAVPQHPYRVGRLLQYIPGDLIVAKPHCPVLMENLGAYLGKMDSIFASIDIENKEPVQDHGNNLEKMPYPWIAHPTSIINESIWNMEVCDSTVETYSGELTQDKQAIVQKITSFYQSYLKPLFTQNASKFPRQFIHGDANDYNLIANHDDKTILAVIDFGDLMVTRRVYDLSTCIAYMMLDIKDENYSTNDLKFSSSQFSVISSLLRGYLPHCALNKEEVSMVFVLALMRICVSVCMSNHTFRLNPENEYLLVTSAPGWRLLNAIFNQYGTIANAQSVFESEVVQGFFASN